MPTFADLLSSQLNPPDPNDQLRDPMGQGQTLTGLAQIPGQGAAPPPQMPPQTPPQMDPSGMPQPVAASPNVLGPLAALASRTPGKPRIRLKTKSPPPNVKKIKPRIKLKASAYGGTI